MKKFAMRAAIAAAAITPMVAFASGVASAESASSGVNVGSVESVTSARPWATPVHACGGTGLLNMNITLFHADVPFPICIKI
ncbi:hypothetical protein [Nocardia sp. NPDC058480]|uniref:hypothetical protein n=1 Tax=unclassified Nocardia TaxID=2637762 RepID=UPI00365F72BD